MCKNIYKSQFFGKIRRLCRQSWFANAKCFMKIVDIYHQHRTIVLLYKLHFIEYLISCRNITSLPKSNVPKKVVAQFKMKMHNSIISIITFTSVTIYMTSLIIYIIQSRSLMLHYLISSPNRWLPIILHNYYKLYISSNMKISSWHIEHYLFYPDRLTHEYPLFKSLFKIVLENPLRILWNKNYLNNQFVLQHFNQSQRTYNAAAISN